MAIQFPRMPEQITRSEAEIIDYISNNPREFLPDPIGAVSQKLGFRAPRFPGLPAGWAAGITRA